MPSRLLPTICALSLVLGAAGCVSSKAGDVYSRDEARRVMTFREGVLVGIKEVRLEGTKSAVGAGAGAVVGGVAGSAVGQGKGSVVAAVLGAVAGGVAGAAAEEGLTREKALELTVRLDNGESLIIVQGIGDDKFKEGERVRVVNSSGTMRVTH
ncbi:glycine zipper 2TM domain-containing protein [Uliginosibacterium sp. H3]|uniref:Glycine zipper 2TM domain-containing protein n=1 Tax=Uliginosibacterium silvisoli TaxID=3114758 RepID=A0ABU6K3H9_9RHOO|nr:glycine zipper 2TM domain-containing protein [Uliginosibacterium sp. H3]